MDVYFTAKNLYKELIHSNNFITQKIAQHPDINLATLLRTHKLPVKLETRPSFDYTWTTSLLSSETFVYHVPPQCLLVAASVFVSLDKFKCEGEISLKKNSCQKFLKKAVLSYQNKIVCEMYDLSCILKTNFVNPENDIVLKDGSRSCSWFFKQSKPTTLDFEIPVLFPCFNNGGMLIASKNTEIVLTLGDICDLFDGYAQAKPTVQLKLETVTFASRLFKCILDDNPVLQFWQIDCAHMTLSDFKTEFHLFQDCQYCDEKGFVAVCEILISVLNSHDEAVEYVSCENYKKIVSKIKSINIEGPEGNVFESDSINLHKKSNGWIQLQFKPYSLFHKNSTLRIETLCNDQKLMCVFKCHKTVLLN